MRPEDQFHDYTLASKLERFVAALEQTLVSWQRTGLADIIQRGYRARIKEQPSQVKVVASLQHRLPWRREPYILQLHLPTALAIGRGGLAYGSAPAPQQQHQQAQQEQQTRSQPAAGAPPPPHFAAALPPRPPAAPRRGRDHGEGEVSQGQSGRGEAAGESGGGNDTPAAAGAEAGGGGGGGSGGVQESSGRDGEPGAAAVATVAPGKAQPVAGRNPDQGMDVVQAAPGGPQRGAGGGGGAAVAAEAVEAAETEGAGEDGSRGGSAVGEGEPGWEVGVDLDLSELLSRIDTIVNDVGLDLDLDPQADVSDSGVDMNQDDDRDRNLALERNREGGAGADLAQQPQHQQQPGRPKRAAAGGQRNPGEDTPQDISGDQPPGAQCRTAEESGTSGRHEDQTTHGSDRKASALQAAPHVGGAAVYGPDGGDAVVAAAAAASAKLASVWPSGRPTALPWWLPTFRHRLQRWFGLDAFLLLHPASFSRRILDETEAGSLLSAAALALAASGLGCPLLLPVHDGLRDAYWGVAVLPGLGCLHLRTDSVHISNPPKALTQLPAQLGALGEQLMPFSPAAAMACLQAAAGLDEQAGSDQRGRRGGSAAATATTAAGSDGSDDGSTSRAIRITWSACFTYRVTRPSRRLRAQVERWAAAAAAAHLGSAGRAGRSPRAHPLDAWHPAGTTAAGRESGAAAAQSYEGDECSSDGGEGEQHDDAGGGGGGGLGREEDGDGLGVFSDADPWDSHAPWRPWAVQTDPVTLLELDVAWDDVKVLQPSNQAQQQHPQQAQRGRQEAEVPQLQVGSAQRWLLHALTVGSGGGGGLLGAGMWRVGLRPREGQRRHVELQRAGADWLWNAMDAESWRRPRGPPPPSVTPVSAASMVGPGSFTVMLSTLLTSRTVAEEAEEVGELLAPEWWEARGWPLPPLPPPYVMQDVLQDLFNYTAPPPDPDLDPEEERQRRGEPSRGAGRTSSSSRKVGGGGEQPAQGSSPYRRTAPLGGLLSRLSLHALLFGNARAVAWLWQRFVRELRFACWEVERQLPRMAGTRASTPKQVPARATARDAAAGRPISRSRSGTAPPAATAMAAADAERDGVADVESDEGDGGSDSSSDSEGGLSADVERVLLRQLQEEPPPPPSPNMRHSLLHQKLQVLDTCIYRRKMMAKQKHLARHLEQRHQQQQRQQQQEQRQHPALHARQQGHVRRSHKHGAGTQGQGGGGGGGAAGEAVSDAQWGWEGAGDDEGWWTELTGGWSDSPDTSGRRRDTEARESPPPPPLAEDGRGRGDGGSGSAGAGAGDSAADGGVAASGGPQRGRSPSPPTGLIAVPSMTDTEAYYSAGDEVDEQPSSSRAPTAPAPSSRWPQGPRRRPRQRRRVRAPGLTQPGPVLSEDRMLERQATLEGLVNHPQGGELAWRMNSEQLASDMAAFKAANPGGCSFADFIAWYSPRDVATVPAAAAPATAPATEGHVTSAGGAPSSAAAAAEGTPSAAPAASSALRRRCRSVGGASEPSAPQLVLSTRMAAGATSGSSALGSASAAAAATAAAASSTAGVASGAGGTRRSEGGVTGAGGKHAVHPATAAAACSNAEAGSGANPPPSSSCSNPWHVLWESTPACPVWRQKPLQDPSLEGERVLHELETISPAHLYDTLLATALASAVQLLEASDGGALSPVASLLRQFVRISTPIVKRGCSLAAACGAGLQGDVADPWGDRPVGQHQPRRPPRAHLQPRHSHQALVGWEDAELEYLLAEFHYLEQAVVLGESLVRRLPGNQALASDLMTSTLHGHTSLEEGRTVLRPAAWVEGPLARQTLAALLAGRCPPPPQKPAPTTKTHPAPVRHQQPHAPRGGADPWVCQETRSGDLDGWEGADWGEELGGDGGSGFGGVGGGREDSRWGRGGRSVENKSSSSSSSGSSSNSSIVFDAGLWPSACSREWLLRVEQPLGPAAQLQQHQHQQQHHQQQPPEGEAELAPGTTHASGVSAGCLGADTAAAPAGDCLSTTTAAAAAAAGFASSPPLPPFGAAQRGGRGHRHTSGGGGGSAATRRILGAERLPRSSGGGGDGGGTAAAAAASGAGAESGGGGAASPGLLEGREAHRGQETVRRVAATGREAAGGQVQAQAQTATAAAVAEAEGSGACRSCTHRLYVLAAEGEMRVATALWNTL